MRLVALAFAALAALAAAPAAAESCVDLGGSQYLKAERRCAGSVLAPQGASTYGPGNTRFDEAAAWCEGASGDGIGEWLRVDLAPVQRFRRVLIGNGFARTPALFAANNRARRVRIETSDGVRVEAELRDTADGQEIVLPRWSQATWVRLTILSVYPGQRHRDTCLHGFSPNLEDQDQG
jgi:hypothetical protein